MKRNPYLKVVLSSLTVAVICPWAQLHANEVTVYGVVDTGVTYTRTNGQVTTAMSPNNLYGSRIGFRGKENLGNGLSAVFTLEMGMKVDDGTLTLGGRTFGREASVGLQNGNHRLLAGRLVSPLLEGVNRYAATHAGPHISNQDPGFSAARVDNAIRYTYTSGGFEANIFRSFGYDKDAAPIGGRPGEASRARNVALSIGYSDPASFGINFVYDRIDGPLTAVKSGIGYMMPSSRPSISLSSDQAERYLLAAKYKLGGADTIFAGYRRLRTKFSRETYNSNLVWLQLRHRFTPNVLVDGGVSYQNVQGADASAISFVMQGQYQFSKRTSAYLNLAYADNSALSVIGTYSNAPVPRGAHQMSIATGVAHWF